MGFKQRVVARDERPEIYEHIDKHIGRLFKVKSVSRELPSALRNDNHVLILLECELRHAQESYYSYDLTYNFLDITDGRKVTLFEEIMDDFFEAFGKRAQWGSLWYSMELIEE